MTTTPTKNKVMLLKKDYDVLTNYINNLHGMQVNEKENFKKLSQELEKAKLVPEDKLPADVIRLGSKVVIVDVETSKEMVITLVMPPHADIKQKKVSVMAPIGTALIGFRETNMVSWEVPAGKKTFLIKTVDNSEIETMINSK